MAVTAQQVATIVDTSTDCAPFLATANAIFNATLQGKGLPSDLSDQIILYLAAHFAVLTTESGGLKRSKLSEADESYRIPGDKDTGLSFTRFGQQAMLLDTSGTLAGLSTNKGLKALFEVI